jgi:hypothetical protein
VLTVSAALLIALIITRWIQDIAEQIITIFNSNKKLPSNIEKTIYLKEDDKEHAEKLLTGNGLNGTVVWGWSDICIDVKGKCYTMEHISNLLLRIGEGSKVTIQVEPGRRRY